MPSPQNGRHLGGDEYFVPTRGTGMESGKKTKLGEMDSMMTTRDGQGQEQGDRGEEGQHGNPFAKASRVARTPTKSRTEEKPRTEGRPRTESCPEVKKPLAKTIWPTEDRDKRKRETASSSSPPTMEAALERDKADDEVFVAEGSLSPEKARRSKRKKEINPFSTNIAGVQIGETEDESALSNGLIQLMQKVENMASEMTWQTKKNVNTKVEIKKLAREIDMSTQSLARKLHKYIKIVSTKIRKSSGSDKDTSLGPTPTETVDAGTQTDALPRKQRRREGEEKMVSEAKSDEEIIEAAKINWTEEWFKATTFRIGNPWNSLGEEDFAILPSASEDAMETGIVRLLKDRFPEVVKIEGTGSLRVTSTVQLDTEDPVIRSRYIYKASLRGSTEAEILSAVKSLELLASKGSGVVAIPVPVGVEEELFRKIVDLVFRKSQKRALIHVPQRKAGKTRIPPAQRPPAGETRKDRKEKNTEVLLIKQGERSYTEMVKGLKTMVGASQRAKTIQQVRKSQDGRMLLEFKKGDPDIAEVRRQITENWEGAQVSDGGKRESAKRTFHVKGLDDAVEDDEIREALCEVAPDLRKEMVEVGPRRPMYGGNLAVTVRIAGKDTTQLRGRYKIKIGFNTCTVEERLDIVKCFRCWDFGHVARNCSGPDRRTLCSGCGMEGHQAAACNNNPHCLLCDRAGHRGGSGSCPKFKNAILEKRTTREMAVPPPKEGK